jgi:hypothetical protein
MPGPGGRREAHRARRQRREGSGEAAAVRWPGLVTFMSGDQRWRPGAWQGRTMSAVAMYDVERFLARSPSPRAARVGDRDYAAGLYAPWLTRADGCATSERSSSPTCPAG